MKAIRIIVLIAATALAACTDVNTGPDDTDRGADMTRYVAIGTSVSMGLASDGVVATTQESSWPKLLSNEVGATFTQPLIDAPGCRPPLAAPLGLFSRVDGSSAAPSGVCSNNSAGVTLPTMNLSVSGATAANAVVTTPATGSAITARVLPAGMTQVTAMRSLNPTFVSVEFGGNEFLPALSGVVAQDITVIAFATFSASYATIIDNVKQSSAGAVLALLPADLRKFPALRTSAEIAAQRAEFVARNVTVNANCDAGTNFIVVPLKVLPALLTGATRAAAGLGPFDLSCADVPATADGVLTEADLTFLNNLVGQMNAFITARAAENGYATFSLGTLYDTSKDGVTFDVTAVLTSNTPFGPRISLDGVHPSVEGQAVLATAARSAIVQTYGTITK